MALLEPIILASAIEYLKLATLATFTLDCQSMYLTAPKRAASAAL